MHEQSTEEKGLVKFLRLLSKNRAIFFILLLLAFANSYIFGLSRPQGWDDASQYSAYAENLINMGEYSLDGVNFSSFREPGYPLTLFLAYSLFGIETSLSFLTVKMSQILMLAVSGFLAFKILANLFDNGKLGIIAGVLTVSMPYYGYYAGDISTEIPFAFSLILSFYLILKIIKGKAAVFDFVSLGFILAYATLIRAQLLFFPFALLLLALILYKEIGRNKLKRLLVSFLIFLLVVGGWAGLVFHKTGHFTVTSGRQSPLIYYRAVRSELSYGDLFRYLKAWIKRSVTGGQTNELLDKQDFWLLHKEYARKISGEIGEKEIQSESINTIIRNFDKYLLGNFVEFIKLMFIEHTYSGSFNKYARAGFYVFLYSFFLYGMVRFILYRQKIFRPVFWLSLIFLSYNVLIITALDAIPRYNTPYLFFYLIVGVSGLLNGNHLTVNQKN